MQQKFGKPFIVENAPARAAISAPPRSPRPRPTATLPRGHGVDACDQPVPLFQAALRHREGFPAGQSHRAPANILVVHPSLPANNVAELIAHLKANPDKLSYGSSGAGTSIHLAAELFKIKTGTTMTHVRSAPPATS